MRRIVALLSFTLCATAFALPLHAEKGEEMQPALTINYTQRNIAPADSIKSLVNQVRQIAPGATYDVVGYETTPKNDFWPVSNRVKQVQDILLQCGVAKAKTYTLIKPTTAQYQKVEIFVHQ